MATLVGEAILIIIGNPDVLKVWAVYAILIALLSVVVYAWKQIEEWR